MIDKPLRLPRVLVLLAACNGAEWIRQQVDSILRQVNVQVSVFVNDDNSRDETLKQLQNCDPRVTLEKNLIPTGSAAQNFFSMIRNTDADKFDFIAFSDQDDIWNQDRLQRAVAILSNGNHVGYSSSVTAFWSRKKTRILSQSSRQTLSDYLFEGAGQGCTFILTKAFYARLRISLIEHRELTANLRYHDWTVYALSRAWQLDWFFDPNSSVMYRQHINNDTGARYTMSGLKKRLRLLSSHWYTNQISLICGFLATVGPPNEIVAEWTQVSRQPFGLARRILMTKFCLKGGRRKFLDQFFLLFAAINGWL